MVILPSDWRQVRSYLQFWSFLHLWPSGQAENTDTQETAGLTYTSGRQTWLRPTGMSLEDDRYSWNHGSSSGQTVETSMMKLCMDLSNYKSNIIYPSVNCVIQSFYLILMELSCHCFFFFLNFKSICLLRNKCRVYHTEHSVGMKGGRVKWMLELNKADFFLSIVFIAKDRRWYVQYAFTCGQHLFCLPSSFILLFSH